MSHTITEVLTPVRQWLFPKLSPLMEEFGGYSTGLSHGDGYACTLEMHPDEVDYFLCHLLTFERNPVAAQKYQRGEEGREWATGSWAKRYIEEEGDGPHWLPSSMHPYLPGWMARMQLHLTLYKDEDEQGRVVTHVFAHWEYNWIVHPIRHKWPSSPPTWMPGWLYNEGHFEHEEGVERFRNILDEAHVPYSLDAP